jgi:PAS domain S-box-containing protein
LQRLAAIVEFSDDAIITKTIEGVVTSWNRGAERVFGYSAQEMLGQSIFRLACVGGEEDMIAVLDQIRRGERVDHYETMRRRKDGTEIAVSLTVSPMRSSSGEIIGASKIARDISARRQTEKAMRIAENLAAVGRLATSIAHDINNPLAAATNLLFLLENENLSEKENTTSQRPNANYRASPTLLPKLWGSTAAAENGSGFLLQPSSTMRSCYTTTDAVPWELRCRETTTRPPKYFVVQVNCAR